MAWHIIAKVSSKYILVFTALDSLHRLQSLRSGINLNYESGLFANAFIANSNSNICPFSTLALSPSSSYGGSYKTRRENLNRHSLYVSSVLESHADFAPTPQASNLIEFQTTSLQTSPIEFAQDNNSTSSFAKTTVSKLKSRKSKRKLIKLSNNSKQQKRPVDTNKKRENYSNANGLLTREDEAKLTYAIRSLRKVLKVRDELVLSKRNNNLQINTSDVTEEEWAEACGLTKSELRTIMIAGKESRSQLVAKNVGLVVQLAKRYHSRSSYNCNNSILTLQDMIQEGNLGLMEAAERFDPKRGFKFGTYATWWVRQRILRSIADHSRVIRLPVHVHTMLNTIDKKRKEMTSVIGRVPSIPELAHELDIPVSKLQLYTDSSRAVLSLEGPMTTTGIGKNHERDFRTISDRIASDNPSPEATAEVDFLREDIRAVVNKLNLLERDVLVQRFGLDDGHCRSIADVSTKLGISRERVKIVEAKAINKLRNPGRNYKLKEYIRDGLVKSKSKSKSKAGNKVNFVNEGMKIEAFTQYKRNYEIPESNSKTTPEQIWSF